MARALPMLLLKHRTLHIVIEYPNKIFLRRGGEYYLRTPDGVTHWIKIIDLIIWGSSQVYPIVLGGQDPKAFVDRVCADSENRKQKNRVVLNFLDSGGNILPAMPNVELYPF